MQREGEVRRRKNSTPCPRPPEPARMSAMIIQTHRLGMRELTQDDFPALCEMLKDGETMRAYEGAFSDDEAHE